MPDQAVTTVHLKDGTTLHLKGANLSPEMVTQKVSAFRATQQPQQAPTPESQRPDATKQAQDVIKGIPKGPAMNEFLDSSQGKEMQTANVDAGKFGADMVAGGELAKAGKALFSPTTITKAGPLVPGGRGAGGRMLPWIESQVSGKGPSLARQGVSGVVSGAKGAAAWLKANPVKALVVEGIARQMGVDPIQLVSKIIKFGGEK